MRDHEKGGGARRELRAPPIIFQKLYENHQKESPFCYDYHIDGLNSTPKITFQKMKYKFRCTSSESRSPYTAQAIVPLSIH